MAAKTDSMMMMTVIAMVMMPIMMMMVMTMLVVLMMAMAMTRMIMIVMFLGFLLFHARAPSGSICYTFRASLCIIARGEGEYAPRSTIVMHTNADT